MNTTTFIKNNSGIIPFPHQSECLSVLETVESVQNRALVVMAGGLGKTILSALNVRRRFQTYGGSRCLFLCHQNDILEQAQLDYRKVFADEVTYGFFHGEEKSNLDANIIFASFQTLREKFDFFSSLHFDEMVVDESQHSMAGTYKPVIQYFKPKFLLGISMIPDRLDGLDIRSIYGKEVYYLSVVEALARELLCPVDYRLMSDEIGSLKKLSTVHGKLSIKLLNSLVFVPKRDEEIAKIIQSHMDALENTRAMIFCPSIEHAEIIAQLLRQAVPLHSKVSKIEKKVRLELFRSGIFNAAVSVDMFNEGLNVPEANLIVFLRSTSSPNIYYNQLARGLRLFPGKERVVVLDFVANAERALDVYELWTKINVERQKIAQTTKQISDGTTTSKVSSAPSKSSIEPFVLNIEEISFKEKVLPIIEKIKKIREGFYSTWKEASNATAQLGITSKEDYYLKYKEDPKLVSYPVEYYGLSGWHFFLTGEEFEPIPDGWSTAQKIQNEFNKVDAVTIKNWADAYRAEHREWFKNYLVKGKIVECFHSDLLKILVKRITTERASAPEGWMTAESLYQNDKFASPVTIMSLVEPFRNTNPEWFGTFYATRGCHQPEYYHPDLIESIRQIVTEKKNDVLPEGWESLVVMAKRMNRSRGTVKKYANAYKEKHSEWFSKYWTGTQYAECFHQDVVKLIETDMGTVENPPPGWRTCFNVAQLIGKSQKVVTNYVSGHRSKKEWFKVFHIKNGTRVEHFHPDLVQLIERSFKKKLNLSKDGKQPPPWKEKRLLHGVV